MKLRKIRTQLLPGVTLCQKDGIGLLAILVERDGLYGCGRRCSGEGFSPKTGMSPRNWSGRSARYGTHACPDVAAAWFPEVGRSSLHDLTWITLRTWRNWTMRRTPPNPCRIPSDGFTFSLVYPIK